MKYLSIIRYVMLGIGVLLVLLFYLGVTGVSQSVDLMIRWTYILLFLAIVCAVVFPLVNLVKNPTGAMRTLVGLGVVVVILLISYLAASDAPITTSAGNVVDDATTLKLSDMGIISAYIALALSIIVIIWGEIRNVFK